MFPDFIPSDLINFWAFFMFLSVLPMILAVVTEKTSAKRKIEIQSKEEK